MQHGADDWERPLRNMTRLVVYTAIFGGYDPLRSVAGANAGVDFVCFTDSENLEAPGWKIRIVRTDEADPVHKNREIKFFPNRFLDGYDESIYIDGNIAVKGSVREFLDQQETLADISLPRHPDRTCVFEEANAVRARGLACDGDLVAQMDRYRSAGLPADFGLTENNLIYRRHFKPKVIELMEYWWREFTQGAPRDQLALPFALWKSNIALSYLEFGPRETARFFQIYPHIPVSGLPWGSLVARSIVARKRQNNFYKVAAGAIELAVSIRNSSSR